MIGKNMLHSFYIDLKMYPTLIANGYIKRQIVGALMLHISKIIDISYCNQLVLYFLFFLGHTPLQKEIA